MRVIIVLLILCLFISPVVNISFDSTEMFIDLGKLAQTIGRIIILIVALTILYNIITGKKP